LLAYIQKKWCYQIKRGPLEECMNSTARYNERHDVREFLDSLVWDGVPRLNKWLTKVFSCPEDAYHQAVGSKLAIAAVRRVRQPGCKFDYLVVLEDSGGWANSDRPISGKSA
jgi:predicted P-loop ATPase